MHTIRFDKLRTQQGDTILDLGCGEGRHALGFLHYKSDINILALDINYKDISTGKKRHEEHLHYAQRNSTCDFIQGSGLQLPFKDNSFDTVICSEVLEHIDDYHGMLEEIKRVLKPRGQLAISVPRYWPEKICWLLSEAYHQVEGGHIRIFHAKKLKQEVGHKGFSPFLQHWAHALHTPYWWLRCLFWRRGNDFILTKSYHRMLVWDLMKKPMITQMAEKILNPILGKSVVMYFNKNDA